MNPTAHPLETEALDWIPLREGVSFRPLRFTAAGYSLQLRVEPGTTIPRHRHTGEVHALNLSGHRELIETREIAGPGTFVYEPPGNVDSWRCVGDAPCIIQITLTGRIEYVDDDGSVRQYSDSETARRQYLDWCRYRGMAPDPALGLGAESAPDPPTPPAAAAGGSGRDPGAAG
jgi:2,4'-dihydroxyacetophenone dioxygenase